MIVMFNNPELELARWVADRVGNSYLIHSKLLQYVNRVIPHGFELDFVDGDATKLEFEFDGPVAIGASDRTRSGPEIQICFRAKDKSKGDHSDVRTWVY